MKAYSVDVREKVLRAVDQGYPRAEIVKLLGVSRATIKRYLKQRRETGSVAPKAIPGRTPKKLGLLQTELVTQLQVHDDLRLEDHCRRLRADAWCASQYNHDEPSYQAHWLDAQKKTALVPVNVVRKSESNGVSR
jgi:transposase